ncbi:hypothetical protein RB195_013652 [Necator americanus]|uniref:Uncharacterized protein n=1 Tax=Necator americanus TaxID=51031 RepID=A0ABR1DWI5_NECAM
MSHVQVRAPGSRRTGPIDYGFGRTGLELGRRGWWLSPRLLCYNTISGVNVDKERSSPSHVLRSYRSMEPHVINSYLLVGVAILLMMAVLVTLLNLAQPPLRRLIKYYFPGEQDYEIIV